MLESFSQSQPTFEEVSNESCESSPIHCGQRKVLLPLTLPPVHIFNRHAYLFLLQWIVLDLVPTFFFALGGAAGGGYSQVIPMEEVRPSNHLQSCACGLFGKYPNTLCLSLQILHKSCFQFLLGLTMVPRENKNNACAKFWVTNKEYYGVFRNGLSIYRVRFLVGIAEIFWLFLKKLGTSRNAMLTLLWWWYECHLR